jgi:general secretion pathway protein M
MNALRSYWASLAAREQRLVSIAAALVGAALLWWLALAPALRTLRSAEAQHAQADAQLQTMQALAGEAASLRGQRVLGYDEALRNLENSVKQTLGAGATLSVSEGRASITLRGVSADALALWLGQARSNARVVPNELRLQRSVSTSGGATAWDGMLVLALPAR